MSTMTKTKSAPGPLRRAGRRAGRVGLTVGVAVVAVLAVQFGATYLAQRAEAALPPAPASILPVATAPVAQVSGYKVRRVFVGQVEPQKTVSLSFELAGQLANVVVDEGDAVQKGDTLATLDTRLLDAERTRLLASQDALEAQLTFAEATVARQADLSDKGFASQAALDEALSRQDELRARIAEVGASLVSNAIQAEKSALVAPFGGIVAARVVDGGESLSPGQAVVQIVQAGAPQLRIGVPLDIAAADLAQAAVEIGGARYSATLSALRPDVDPVTRTRTALFTLATDDPLAFGQTARLVMSDRVESPGLWVPVTALKEGLRGQWTLMAVDAQDVARVLSVQVLHTEGQRVFVRGAFPEGTRLITQGPQRVTPGQRVDPQPAS